MTQTYINPVTSLDIVDWPLGRDKRGQATFRIESNKRGERAVRTTTGKPKALTYARKVLFAKGSEDGKLYVLELGLHTNAISVMRGTFDYQEEYIPESDPRHATLRAYFTD